MTDNKRKTTVQELLNLEGIKASLYMPTHRAFPENKQDPIVYKNMIQQIEKALSEKHPRREWEGLMAALNQLAEDTAFWNHTLDGLGVLVVGDRLETFVLEQPVTPFFTLGPAFNLLPLFRLSDMSDRAYLADISKDRFKLFAVHASSVEEIDQPSIKSSFPELFEDYDSNSTLRTGSYRGLSGAYHGQGGRSRQAEVDMDKYFRYLDSSFQKLHEETGLPMIIAGTEATLAEFMKRAKGSFYLNDPVAKPIDSMDANELQTNLHSVLQPHAQARLERLNTFISNKRNENKVLAKPADIKDAALQGNVEMLILSQDLSDNTEAALLKAAEDTLRFGGTLCTADPAQLGIAEKSLALLRASA